MSNVHANTTKRRVQRRSRRYNFPVGTDRLGWHKFYVKRFNKTGTTTAEWLAIWYLFLHFSEEDRSSAVERPLSLVVDNKNSRKDN